MISVRPPAIKAPITIMAAPAGAAIGSPVGTNAGNANTSSINPGVESPSVRTMLPKSIRSLAIVDIYIRSRTDGLGELDPSADSVASEFKFVFPCTFRVYKNTARQRS
jgi:hypothetical protein